MIWQGSLATIPTNWVLCDGNNGTPDLRDRFIVGSQLSYAQNDTDGFSPHTHTFASGSHDHSIEEGDELDGGSGFEDQALPNFISGTTDQTANLPTWYSLAYIQYQGVPNA